VNPAELVERIWARDPSVWTGGDEASWLGWLDEPMRMQERLEELAALPRDFDDIVLLGMGGSSLAPEVIRRVFEVERFHVLDTTHPSAVRRLEERLDPARTLFVAASKSGTTLETRSHLDYFLERGGTFGAITDPGSELASLAREREFAFVVAGEPTIGGRYSALSPFGMVPAALMGLDVADILAKAEAVAAGHREVGESSYGLTLGTELGEAWRAGRDKVCIELDPPGFALWAEQLVAESTGKQGRGLVPAPGEEPAGPDRIEGWIPYGEPYDIGSAFFSWEFAVAVAGSILGINPFDQPDVQAAKDKTNEVLRSGDIRLEPSGSLDDLLAGAEPPQYVAILAFIDPAREPELEPLVARARETGCVVTKGLGPRYLHSTGQLHKGGPNTGLFVQVVDDLGEELAIPGRDFGFRRLIAAQAAGDFAALEERGRRIVRLRLEEVSK
jgi:transaldolase/glucose-6-phosphate isomerase